MSTTRDIQITNEEAQVILGIQDGHIEFIEKLLQIEISGRGNSLQIKGSTSTVNDALPFFELLKDHAKHRKTLTQSDILNILAKIKKIESSPPNEEGRSDEVNIFVDSKKKIISPRSAKQTDYIKAIRDYDIVLGIGPAGTGKTYLSVACAIEAVKRGQFQRVIFTRPAIEAGERLGFLPGDLEEKIRPYLQPIYDALFDIMRHEELKRWTERKILDIVPLAYMRGRTLSDAFIILDEAQNTTFEQMKMFLTRLGINSKAILTGDITQIDLPLSSNSSGLVEAQTILKEIEGIKFISFSNTDVVRHKLVKKIIAAYDKKEKTGKKSGDNPKKRAEKDKA